MIDDVLDWIYDKKIKAIKRRSKRLHKYHTAALELHDIKSKVDKLKPRPSRNATFSQNRPSVSDKLADFGEKCANTSEKMNQNLFGKD